MKSTPLFVVILAVLVLNTACSLGSECASMKIDSAVAACLAARPKENIKKNPQVNSYLKKHKVYISVTSSPKRLGKIPMVLKTLDQDLIEKIFISLPEKFRDKEEYTMSAELKDFPKVEILQGGEDLGPIMKLLPAIRRVKELGDLDAIVVTVDDDTGYDADLLGQLVKHAILHHSVAASKGMNVDNWGIDGKLWPEKGVRSPGCYSGYDFSYCDVVEGYGAIAYPVRLVDADLLETLAKLTKACKMSDDLTISFGLAASGSPRGVVTTISFFDGVVQFPYGFEEDALHRGSGFLSSASVSSSSAGRYRECAQTLHEWYRANSR